MQEPYPDLAKIKNCVQLQDKEMLEVGCGDGRLSALLGSCVRTLVAVDPDKAKIASAKNKTSAVDFRVGSGENLGFENEVFDIVLFSYSLHHQNCQKALPEAIRVLRKNGNIIIIEPTYDSHYTQMVSVFEKDEIQRLNHTLAYLKSGRFKITREETYFVDYPFRDDNECLKFFLDHYAAERSDRSIEEMKALLISQKTAQPFVLRDKVTIFIAGK